MFAYGHASVPISYFETHFIYLFEAPALMVIMCNPSPDIKALEQRQKPFHQRLGRKLFVQMSGAPGSGKTTTANRLARRIDAVVIPHDKIKSLLLDSGVSFGEAGKMAYGLDWVLAEDAMRQELSFIVDTPCLYPQILDRGHALTRAYGYKYCYAERTAIDDVPRDADKYGGGAETKDAARDDLDERVDFTLRQISSMADNEEE
ncbi:hypothetical protein F4678DRAFT_465554 [Xylaria arbuscula]|nr:hypothetical protein F4678DRAFT_465554 [Xylaria arbuscula]